MNPIVAALAAKRLTQLVTDDEITRPVRERVEKWGDAHGYGSFPERISYLVSCSACASVYAAAVVLVAQRHRIGRMGNGILALSAAALFVDAVIGRLER